MKKIINFIFACYFSYNFIFYFNKKILIHFIFYLIFDLFFIIFFDNKNNLKNDLILHHINGIFLCYSTLILSYNYNINLVFYDKLYSIQEITTIIITFKNLINNDNNLKKYINILLNILWIPLRIIIPYISIILTFLSYKNNLYFRLKIFFSLIFLFLNVKWTLQFLKYIENNYHFSSLFLLVPIIFIKNEQILFNNIILLSLFSYIYNLKKNIYTLSLDISNISIFCLNLSLQLNIYILFIAGLILFILKINYKKNEIHSLIIILSIIISLINYPKILIFNIIIIFLSYLYRHYTKITFLWHLSCAFCMLCIMYKNNKLII